jgi:hypothetical protein
MRQGWRHWYQPGDLLDNVYHLDDLGLRFAVTVTPEQGAIIRVLKHDRSGLGWVCSEIKLPKLLVHETFDAAMIAAEKLRDWLARKSEPERQRVLSDWNRQAEGRAA